MSAKEALDSLPEPMKIYEPILRKAFEKQSNRDQTETETNQKSRSEDHVKQLKEKIENGDAEAMNSLAFYLVNKNDMTESIKYYKMAIDRGNAVSMQNYAFILYKGIGCPQDVKEALKYFKMAGDHGLAESMYQYACMVENGEGTEINMEEAIKCFKIAAENDFDIAYTKLGSIYEMGTNGIQPDINKAMKYYKIAADKGRIDGMHQYAQLLSKTNGDQNEIYRYIKMAADAGDVGAMCTYSMILKEGILGEPDPIGAMKYHLMAMFAANLQDDDDC